MSADAKTLRAASGHAPHAANAHDDLVTESFDVGHSQSMVPSRMQPANAVGPEPNAWLEGECEPATPLSVDGVYEAHFDFVWRSARRLGASPHALDDVVQEVFLVVHRKLDEFAARSSLKSWLFGITRRVVRDQRRARQRRPTEVLDHDPQDSTARAPDELSALHQQAVLLHALLETLDDDKREAFVLAELEQMSGPEIAEALQLNLNTAYARVRSARQAFELALQRHEARTTRKAP